MPSRQDQVRLTVSVDGKNLGVWEDKTGGDTDSNSTQHFLGGMGPRISLGGPQQVANVVLMKLEDLDILSNKKWLRSRAGKGKVLIGEQVLDDEGNALADPDVYNGTLKRVKPSDRNANSNTAAMFEIEVEVSGQVG